MIHQGCAEKKKKLDALRVRKCILQLDCTLRNALLRLYTICFTPKGNHNLISREDHCNRSFPHVWLPKTKEKKENKKEFVSPLLTRLLRKWTVCKIQRHLGLPWSAILKVVSLVSRLLDHEALVHAHQYKPSKVCSVKLWELGRFLFVSLSLCLDPAQARVVALDTSGPMTTNCGDGSVLRPRRLERPKRIIHLMSRSTRRRRARTCCGWGFPRLDCLTAEPSSLGTPPIVHRPRSWRWTSRCHWR